MSKYDDFDLDVKSIKSSDGEGISTKGATGGIVCWSITVSIGICEDVSKAIDCLSKESECSGIRSQCGPCTVSSARMGARC